MNRQDKRVILAITGASGVILGIRTLELLRDAGMETHLVISRAARRILPLETSWKIEDVEAMASFSYDSHQMSARIASGSFPTRGMIIVPCSVKTLSGIANSYANNLIIRAADVCLKEGKPVLLAVRETPLHAGHLALMKKAVRAGATIIPPVPSFYGHPKTIEDLCTDFSGRLLLRLGIDNESYAQWMGE